MKKGDGEGKQPLKGRVEGEAAYMGRVMVREIKSGNLVTYFNLPNFRKVLMVRVLTPVNSMGVGRQGCRKAGVQRQSSVLMYQVY